MINRMIKTNPNLTNTNDYPLIVTYPHTNYHLSPLAGSESSSSEVVTEKTVPLVWPSKLKAKVRDRVPHIVLISPHGTGLGGEGFTRMYLPLPKHPPKDLMMLPCMVAYLPFQVTS